MRDFKYRKLLIDNPEWKTVMLAVANVRSDCLKECAAAFHANLDRTGFVQMWPAEIAFQVRRDTIWQCNAANLTEGRSHSHIMQVINQKPTPEFMYAMDVQINELEEQPIEVQHFLRTQLGIQYIEKMLEMNQGMQLSIDALFASIVVSSWTAFECLASDAWVKAVNNGPKEWRIKVNDSRHVKLKPGEPEDEKPDLKIDPLEDYAGSLREAGRVSFQRLSTIKRNYSIIFDKPTMRMLFDDAAGGYIAALSQVRNILAHKAGVADGEFEKKTKTFPELSVFKEKNPVLLDGEIVKKLRNAALIVGEGLIRFIDDIITPAPAAPSSP